MTYQEKIDFLLLLTDIQEVNTTQIVYLPELVQIGHYIDGEPVYVMQN